MKPTIYLDVDGVIIGYGGRDMYSKPDFDNPNFFHKPGLLRYGHIDKKTKSLYELLTEKIKLGWNVQILSYVPEELFEHHCAVKELRIGTWLILHGIHIPEESKRPHLFIPYQHGVCKIDVAVATQKLKIQQGDILIDDELSNLSAFEARGGTSYHPDCFR